MEVPGFSAHVKGGTRKQLQGTGTILVLTRKDVPILACTGMSVAVCMRCVPTRVMIVYLIAVEMKICLKMLQFQHTDKSRS